MRTENQHPRTALPPLFFVSLLLIFQDIGAYERTTARQDENGLAERTIQTFRSEHQRQSRSQDEDRTGRQERDEANHREQQRPRNDNRTGQRPRDETDSQPQRRPRTETHTERQSRDEASRREQHRPRVEAPIERRAHDQDRRHEPPRPDANRHYETRPRPPAYRPPARTWTYPYPRPYPRVRILPRPHYHHRNIIILRPFPYSYPHYRRFYYNDDIWGWLAFTTITLAILDRLDDDQRHEHELALHLAITLPLGESSSWSLGHAHGTITPVWQGMGNNGLYCREFRHEVIIDDETDVVYGTACQRKDGSWEIVE